MDKLFWSCVVIVGAVALANATAAGPPDTNSDKHVKIALTTNTQDVRR